MTRQRALILEILQHSPKHLTADEILVAGAVVAYIKRDAIREAKNDIIADVKRLLKKEKPEIAG